MTHGKLFSARRVGVCGSSKELPATAIPFCEAAGAELAKHEHVVIVSGGSRQRPNTGDQDLATDWHIVNAAVQVMRCSGPGRIEERVETVLSDPVASKEYFIMGTLRQARGKTREARRFSFVRSVDALLAVCGRGGTAQELALALELDIPVLPVPLFGGSAAQVWHAYKDDLVPRLRLDARTVQRWEGKTPTARQDLEALAVEMVGALLGSLERRCFVIMPFAQDFAALYDFVIEPVIRKAGDHPIRLDRAAVPGDVGGQIIDGIRQCDYVIAVLDGLRPNVLYELGLAHGRGKPTVLLNRAGSLGDVEKIPFDLSMHQRLEYEAVDAGLVQRLERTLAELPTSRDGPASR
jgi:hypothetical protein